MKTARWLWLVLPLLGTACGDAPSPTGSGSSGSDTSGSDNTPGQDSTRGPDVDGTTSVDETTSGSGTTTALETGTTTEPPHETDWGLCTIDVVCDLPIVDEPKRTCMLTVMEGDGYVVYDGPAGFENRGRSSNGWPKHQYSVELWETPNIELVSPGSTWRYNDGPTVGGADWMDPDFDDSGWAQGEAPLGYGLIGPNWAVAGQIPNATTIEFGPNPGNKYITSWYRQEFEVVGAAALDPVQLNVRADDGVVVYINGSEAARFNMPAGPIDANTPASAALDSLSEIEFSSFRVDAGLLVEGTNVIAVELHQAGGTSSDVVLDLSLSTKPSQAPTNFYEFGQESDWIFNGMYFDLSLYRNKLMYDLFTAIDPEANYGPESHYCELTLNGDWHGIYTLGEKIKRDDDRVDIMEQMGAGESFIFKSDVTKIWVATNGVGWQLVYPKLHDVTPGVANGLNAFMSGFAAATAGAGSVWDYVDMASMVDWVLLQELTLNGDAYLSSMHIYKDVDGMIEFVPWDFDIGMGGLCDDPTGWIYRWDGFWMNTIVADAAFRTALATRWEELRGTVLSDEALQEQVDGYIETMTPEKIAQNFDRWPMDEIIGGDDWVLPFREPCPVQTWDEEHEYVQGWLANRVQWMDENIWAYN